MTSSGVPFLELIQPLAVRRHGHCSIWSDLLNQAATVALPSIAGQLKGQIREVGRKKDRQQPQGQRSHKK
jgi:hypothetical protein